MKVFCDSKYLVFPVGHNSTKKQLLFKCDGELVFDLDIHLDYKNPDFFSYINVERFEGKTLTISCVPEMHLEIKKANVKYKSDSIYSEKYRPQFHFSAKRGWLNDPNGLFYYNGNYHLFFQHNPAGCQWGNMHWGHAVSRDLLHWDELECALYPDRLGTMFSGSAIVDHRNVTGLKQGNHHPIILFYTAAGGSSKLSADKEFTQCIAYSTDGGNTFTPYDGNPIIDNIIGGNRDPKVHYDPVSGRYIMALYLDKNNFMLLFSKNLIDWEKGQTINLPDDAECPDFYPLPVDGNEDNIKWVFSAASDKYLVGIFDGNCFTPETEIRQLHYGKNSYASQTWSDTPNGRKLRISWNTFEIPGMPFNKCMTFPCEMTLKSQNNEPVLCANPIGEIQNLYKTTYRFNDLVATPNSPFSYVLEDECYDMTFEIQAMSQPFDIRLFGVNIHCEQNQLRVFDSKAPINNQDTVLLRLLVDKTGVEIFIDDGSAYLSVGALMDYNLNRLKIESDKTVKINRIEISPLKSIWESKI